MIRKQITLGFIALAMILMTLTGCRPAGLEAGSEEPSQAPVETNNNDNASADDAPAEEPTEAPAETPTDAPAPTPSTPPVEIGWHLIPQRADDEEVLEHMEEVLSAMLQERGVNVQLPGYLLRSQGRRDRPPRIGEGE